LIAGQLGQMAMGIVDTVMIGRVGVVPLGACTLANTIVSVPFILGIGLLTSVTVLVSQARGAERPADAQEAVRHGTWLALGYGVLVFLLIVASMPWLGHLGQPAEVVAATPRFLLLIALSLIPALLSMTWKNHADALSHPWRPFVILLGGVGLNAGLNWLWIYGNLGFPEMGLEGAGWATLTARVVTAVATFAWMTHSPFIRPWWPARWRGRCSRAELGKLLHLGLPASFGMLTEVSAFSAASLMVGTLGAAALAAHQVALTCAATTFMVPLGVAMAMTVRVGEVVGAQETHRLHRVVAGGWLFAVGFMSVSMIAFLLAGRVIAGWFIRDDAVVVIAAQLLAVAGLFQLFDGLQVVSAGALRGIGDVRVPAGLSLLAYWGIALPLGGVLGLLWKQGPVGVWLGLATGLGVAAVALGVRAWRRLSPEGLARHAAR
jgi:MATE family multidrug resistance protein